MGKKRWVGLNLLLILMFLSTGCSVEKVSTKKVRDVDFTVVSELEMTDEVKKIVEEKKTAPFKVTFSDHEYTYIIIGYGKQNYEGYRITVKELYESPNAVYVKTEFSGPKEYSSSSKTTYPYIVIKIECTDKNIVFGESE